MPVQFNSLDDLLSQIDVNNNLSDEIDIENYVRSKAKKPLKIKPHEPVEQHVTLDINTYLEYLIWQRGKKHERVNEIKKKIFYKKLNNFLLWIIKVILIISFTLLLICAFWLMVWYVQNSLFYYWQSVPSSY